MAQQQPYGMAPSGGQQPWEMAAPSGQQQPWEMAPNGGQ